MQLQNYFERSQARQEVELREDGNPKLDAMATDKKYSYQQPNKKEQLYKKGKGDTHAIAANDVKQGDLEECYVLSPLAALAQNNPDSIEELIEEQEDGSYNVTLYLRKNSDSMEREKVIIKVKNEFVKTYAGKAAYTGGGDKELWVQVFA